MNEPAENTRETLLRILGAPGKRTSESRRGWLVIGVILLVLAGYFAMDYGGTTDGSYITEDAFMGNLDVMVTASGTLQPTTSVDVGSEQSGTLMTVLVQENDYVKEGQLLAVLDTAKLKDAISRSQAALAVAEADVDQTRATAVEARATLSRLQHVAELSGGKVPAKTELETAEAALQRAIANQASARASVAQARADLATNETNLSKAIIRSPVDGVVLSRNVEPGQTVVSSMTIPVLFTLAEDLTKMELQVNVDEADVSSVALGQPATFTVAAWPGRRFPATIRRVGIGSTITDNVVTYKTVLDVENADLALRPGMTATATIVTAHRENVLLVPNAALRYTPPQDGTAAQSGNFVSRLMPRAPFRRPQRDNGIRGGATEVWVLVPDGPMAVSVETGVSNGRHTEINGGDLKAGMAVITDYQAAQQ